MGGNVGDVAGHFRAALAGLRCEDCRVTDVSRLYRSLAWQPEGATSEAPDFLNAACSVTTSLSPQALLARLQSLEAAAGRARHERWAPRPLDLDLLLYGDQVVNAENLTVPHPELYKRPFVLLPLADLDPSIQVPPTGKTVADWLTQLPQPYEGVRVIAERGWPQK